MVVELTLPLHSPGIELSKQADVNVQEHLYTCVYIDIHTYVYIYIYMLP